MGVFAQMKENKRGENKKTLGGIIEKSTLPPLKLLNWNEGSVGYISTNC